MQCENIFRAESIGPDTGRQRTQVKVGDIQLQVPGQHRGKIKFVIRPEDVLVSSDCRLGGKNENAFQMTLVRWRDYGSYVRVELNGHLDVVAYLSHADFAKLKAKQRSDVVVVLSMENIHVLG